MHMRITSIYFNIRYPFAAILVVKGDTSQKNNTSTDV